MAELDNTQLDESPMRDSNGAAAEGAYEQPKWDDALLIKVKGKVKKPVKPDDTERNLQVQKLQAEIQKHSDRIRELKEMIELKRAGAKGISAPQKELNEKVNELRSEWQNTLRQKQHVREELNEVMRNREEIRSQMRAIKEKVRFIRPDDLEERIQQLEYQLNHESLTPAEEKRAHDNLQRLLADKPLAREHSELVLKLEENDRLRDETRKRMEQYDEVLNKIKEREQVHKDAMAQIRAREQDHTADIPTMNVEKQECWEVICALRDKIKEIREAYDQKFQEYIKLDKNYRGYMKHVRHQEYLSRQKEREAREKEKQVAMNPESIVGEPYEMEVFTIDQTLTYLKKYLAPEDQVETAGVKEVQAPEAGMKLLKKKGDEELDSWFGGSAKKNKAAKKTERKVQKMNHTMETLKTFMYLKVEVPHNTSEVPKTIEVLEQKKTEFLQKREAAKKDPAAYLAEQRAAAEAAAAEAAAEAAARENRDKEEAGGPAEENGSDPALTSSTADAPATDEAPVENGAHEEHENGDVKEEEMPLEEALSVTLSVGHDGESVQVNMVMAN